MRTTEPLGRMDPWGAAALEQNRRWLMAFLLGAMGDRAAAEDLVQEVFSVAYEKRESFEPGTNFGGWLRQIARNCLRRHFDRAKKLPVLVGDAMHAYETAAMQAEDELRDPDWLERHSALLEDCLQRLRERARSILEMKYLRGLRSDAIAKALRMTVSAVNVTVYRSRLATADCMKEQLHGAT